MILLSWGASKIPIERRFDRDDPLPVVLLGLNASGNRSCVQVMRAASEIELPDRPETGPPRRSAIGCASGRGHRRSVAIMFRLVMLKEHDAHSYLARGNLHPGPPTETCGELIELLADKAAEAFRDPFSRALLRRLLTLGSEGQAVLEGHLSRTIAIQRAALTRAIVEAQQHGDVARDINPEVALDAVVGGLIYKLLSGQADALGDNTTNYVKELFCLVGLASR